MLKRHGCAWPCPAHPIATHGRALHEQQQPLWSCAKRESDKQKKLNHCQRTPSHCICVRLSVSHGAWLSHDWQRLLPCRHISGDAGERVRDSYARQLPGRRAHPQGGAARHGRAVRDYPPPTQLELATGFWLWTRAHGFGELAWAAQEGPRWQETTAGLKCCTMYDLSFHHKGHANAACEYASSQGHQVELRQHAQCALKRWPAGAPGAW